MKHTIGIGALFENEAFNYIRSLELGIYEDTNDFKGLTQPPHVTVKRPFLVNDMTEIQYVDKIMQQVGHETQSFSLELSSIKSFSKSVLYLNVEDNQILNDLHLRLIKTLSSKFPGSVDQFDGDGVIFHATIGMGMNKDSFNSASKLLKSKKIDILNKPIRISKLGLFLALDDESQWVIISETPLAKLKY